MQDKQSAADMLDAGEWKKHVTDRLSPEEWPEGVLGGLDATVVVVLSEIRKAVGRSVWPSPVEGAHVRDSGDSRHSTQGGDRLSDATDWFVRWEDAPRFFTAALMHPDTGGVGIYDAMRFREKAGDYCMFHIDLRSDPLVWVGHGRDPVEYVYSSDEPARMYELIHRMFREAV